MAMKAISLAFSKLVLDVKAKFLLISWHYLVVFLVAPPSPTRPFIDTLTFVILKVFRWYVSGPSFIYV